MRTLLVLALLTSVAYADPPKVGDTVGTTGVASWPAPKWLYDSPSASDAAGKVLVLWFCSPKGKTCADDLARIINLRDTNHVYVVAFINGMERDAKKLDPIRESEGVGRGTVAYGPAVAKIFKDMKLTTGPAAVVADVNGAVKVVTTSGDINELDARDQIVTKLIADIHEYTSAKKGAATAKPNEKLALGLDIQLASWLHYKPESPAITLTAPKQLKCEKATKIDGQTLAASVTCSGPTGNYQVQAKIQFGYKTPSGADGLGEDGATWSFEIK
jgi:hypothetical protein